MSLMPPADYCASCKGKKAKSKALGVATTRETAAFEASRPDLDTPPSPGALQPIAALFRAWPRLQGDDII